MQKFYVDKNNNPLGTFDDGGKDTPHPFGKDAIEVDSFDDIEVYKNNIRRQEIYTRLAQIDQESVRPLRAKLNGTNTQDDDDTLSALESEAQALRDELAAL